MNPEPNHGLTFAQEIFLAIRRDGELIAVESQNGHIQRYVTKEAMKADTLSIFGADKAQQSQTKTEIIAQ
jgi:hypothetical protein